MYIVSMYTIGMNESLMSRRRLLGAGLTAAAGVALAGRGATTAAASTQPMTVLRTPEDRFAGLAGYAFPPRYLTVRAGDGAGTRLRVHYVDQRPRAASGETVLLLHGEPTWSYLYRHMITQIVAAGHRCVAVDLVGFGRSDKPALRTDYTYQRHVDWLRQAVFGYLDLRGVTMVCHDWGGLLGLRLLAEHPGRFRRVIATNTYLPTGEEDLGEAFRNWLHYSQQVPVFDVGSIVDIGTVTALRPEVRSGYDAPFPDESYKAAARQFPVLVPTTPDDPAAKPNRRAWRVLERLHTPFLCAFSDRDFGIGGGPTPFLERVPGAAGQPHVTIANGGHFVQEDQGPVLADIVNRFMMCG
jgi:haloalkane dehalogenase